MTMIQCAITGEAEEQMAFREEGDTVALPRQRPALRVLHVLAISAPHVNGYALRSKYIVDAQRQEGIVEPTVVTSCFYGGNPATVIDQVIEGTEYLRIPHPIDERDDRSWKGRATHIAWRVALKGSHVYRSAYYLRRAARRALLAIARRAVGVAKRNVATVSRLRRATYRRAHRRIRATTIRLFGAHALPMESRTASPSPLPASDPPRQSSEPPSALNSAATATNGRPSSPRTSPTKGTDGHRRAPSGRQSGWSGGRLVRSVFAARERERSGSPGSRNGHRRPPMTRRIEGDRSGEPGSQSPVLCRPPFRLPLPRIELRARLASIAQALLERRFEKRLDKIVRARRPEVLHAHSPHWCGRVTARVAQRWKIPFVYEVRGCWEESAVAEGRWTRSDSAYWKYRNRETEVMQTADAVICICEQLQQEVIRRGVPPSRVFLSPNAVAPCFLDDDENHGDVQSPPLEHGSAAPVAKIRSRLSAVTLGYIGSIRKLEGVDELVRGTAELVGRGYDVSLLVVGGGARLAELKELAADLGIEDRCVFTGRVPHEQIRQYYRLIDIFVVSRPATRVAEIVTPLKPLEAMAMQKTLVVSRLAALCELVRHGETGMTYEPNNISALADTLAVLVRDRALRERLAKNGRRWVQEHRTWGSSLQGSYAAYEKVLKRRLEDREAEAA